MSGPRCFSYFPSHFPMLMGQRNNSFDKARRGLGEEIQEILLGVLENSKSEVDVKSDDTAQCLGNRCNGSTVPTILRNVVDSQKTLLRFLGRGS